METEFYTLDFTANSNGDSISFEVDGVEATIENVSLKRINREEETIENYPIKEFLVGETDDEIEIQFRADTTYLQLVNEFEDFVNPLAVITKLQRGTAVKCFIALGDDPFYELEGTATKGVSVIKVPSKSRGEVGTPPMAREVRISWRDSSKQLCRLTQGGIIFLPTGINYSE